MNLFQSNRKRKVLIVSHDAGGAEVVSSWARSHPENKYSYVLTGPAISIFTRKMKSVNNSSSSSLSSLISKHDLILTSISWASDLEKRAILLAKKKSVKVISFLDHWVNYIGRFTSKNKLILPDEIWVTDKIALNIARAQFPHKILRLTSNPYFEDIKEELSKKNVKRERHSKLRILYLCEPIAEHSIRQYGHANYWGYTEFEALEKFLKRISLRQLPAKIKAVRIRLHPSEKVSKYDKIIKQFSGIPITISHGTSLIEDCLWSDWIVGCESMALVVGVLASKKVFSVIPLGGRKCQLPYKKIKNLFTVKM